MYFLPIGDIREADLGRYYLPIGDFKGDFEAVEEDFSNLFGEISLIYFEYDLLGELIVFLDFTSSSIDFLKICNGSPSSICSFGEYLFFLALKGAEII
jgi:hypothetical protein